MAGMSISDLVVLVVEPSSTQRRIIVEALHDAGVQQPMEETTGAAALDHMRADQPDLVISALYLPDMTGTDLVHHMRADADLEDLAFMLVSSETRIGVLDPIRQAGAIAILPKPFDKMDLRVALNSTLSLIDPESLSSDGDYENLEVLVVDDSSLSRKHIRRVLSDMGIARITEAVDGVEALSLINEQYFDFVVTDYNMPQMDGRELVEAIRHESTQSSLPVLMVTSEHSSNRLAAVQKAGVSAICDKPFEPATVRVLVTSMLDAA